MHTAQGGEPAGSLSYETDSLVRIDLTTYSLQWTLETTAFAENVVMFGFVTVYS